MSVLIFGRSHAFGQLLWIFGGLCAVGGAFALFAALNEDFSAGRLFGKSHERFWAWASLAALGFFSWAALEPFLPGSVFGLTYWPIRYAQAELWTRLALLIPFGAAVFFVASDEGLAGGFWGWKPILGPGWKRPLLFGAAAGAGFALLGVCANRGLFLAEALTRIGYPDAGFFLYFAIPALWLLGCAAIVALPAYGWVRDPWQKLILGAGLATAWVIPVELGEAYLRLQWHFGPMTLADAARLPAASEAPRTGLLVLAERDGTPGRQYREATLTSRGVALGLRDLEKLEAYLKRKNNRTLYLSEAVAAIRRGWFLHWRPEKHLDWTMADFGNRFPPDYRGFLAAIRVAPATAENRERLDAMAARAAKARFRQVKTAQKTFEGFSTAYARFGDLEKSNAWLDRIRGLWPLFEDDIHIEPIEENFDGWIGGRLLFNGRPASGIRVGLFALPSTTTVVGAYDGLVAAAVPDENGRFEFTELTSGRYYLALRADPLLLGAPGLGVRNAPGVITLRFGEMTEALLPVELDPGGGVNGGAVSGGETRSRTRKGLDAKPPADLPLKSLPGMGRSR